MKHTGSIFEDYLLIMGMFFMILSLGLVPKEDQSEFILNKTPITDVNVSSCWSTKERRAQTLGIKKLRRIKISNPVCESRRWYDLLCKRRPVPHKECIAMASEIFHS
ncbi:uncharacterized protein LOC113304682 isoform X2 [Papaver somniferum]|uniref:uncharacterized protein LOC113304682 isoform X2 n=1 Tax=Papaver somniferum TaxID=3469 RepID=UPI000E7013AC|nr:uncharacterized protein LOC113304682 isoform X2 [Papaver somniferum]